MSRPNRYHELLFELEHYGNLGHYSHERMEAEARWASECKFKELPEALQRNVLHAMGLNYHRVKFLVPRRYW